MLNYIVNFIKSLNSNSKPSQIANSFCIGMVLGFMPKDNVFWYLLFIFFAFVRINKAGYYIMIAIVSLFAFLLDPIFDVIGYWFLNLEFLRPLFAFLLDVPFVGFTKFNNTIVMGSFLFSLLIYIPFYVLFFFGVKLWRKKIAPKFNDSKILKALYKIPVVGKLTQKISQVM